MDRHDGILRPNMERDYPDYLRDESRRTGRADTISFPESESDIRQILAQMQRESVSVTVQGARTGITAGAVPDGGHVMNLSRMTRVTGLRPAGDGPGFLLAVEPGVVLADLQDALARSTFATAGWTDETRRALEDLRRTGPFFLPPDPTETTATIGGMTACNASGARSFGYGPTRRYIAALRVVLADGSAVALRRGRERADGRHFRLEVGPGRTLCGSLPGYRMPDVKNAAGYYAADGMDLLDLFVGSEGTLGVISEVEMRVIPTPGAIWGLTVFLPDEAAAIRFVRAARGDAGAQGRRPVAIEFFDRRALALISDFRKRPGAFSDLPAVPANGGAAVYLEYHGESDDAVAKAVEGISAAMKECGGRDDATWIATNEREMEPLRRFRHGVPEAVNLTIDERRRTEPSLTKLGTDMAVPDDSLEDVIALYRSGLEQARLEYVMFGHIGNNHVHVNILPRNRGEYETGRQLYLEWAAKIIRMGGTISAEHGVGKLKVALLEAMYGPEGIEAMRAVKRIFDPEFRLNRGNLFSPA